MGLKSQITAVVQFWHRYQQLLIILSCLLAAICYNYEFNPIERVFYGLYFYYEHPYQTSLMSFVILLYWQERYKNQMLVQDHAKQKLSDTDEIESLKAQNDSLKRQQRPNGLHKDGLLVAHIDALEELRCTENELESTQLELRRVQDELESKQLELRRVQDELARSQIQEQDLRTTLADHLNRVKREQDTRPIQPIEQHQPDMISQPEKASPSEKERPKATHNELVHVMDQEQTVERMQEICRPRRISEAKSERYSKSHRKSLKQAFRNGQKLASPAEHGERQIQHVCCDHSECEQLRACNHGGCPAWQQRVNQLELELETREWHQCCDNSVRVMIGDSAHWVCPALERRATQMLEEKNAEIESMRRQAEATISQKDGEIARLEEVVRQRQASISQKDGEIARLQGVVREREREVQEREQEISRLDAALTSKNDELDSKIRELNDSRTRLRTALGQQTRLRSQLELARKQVEIKDELIESHLEMLGLDETMELQDATLTILEWKRVWLDNVDSDEDSDDESEFDPSDDDGDDDDDDDDDDDNGGGGGGGGGGDDFFDDFFN